MKIYAVYDTNILVSALISKRSDTAVVKAVGLLMANEVTPLYNDEILAEYKEVLRREQFRLPEDLIIKIIRQIEMSGIASERIHSDEFFSDPDDVVFYEVALSREDSYLVTGNIKHFPKTPIVVTPEEFLKIIIENLDKSHR